MRIKNMRNTNNRARTSERGAALIMMLLVATLLLAAGGALILSSAVTGTTAIDATAEKQAYYAAEAGLQQTMNSLRGNLPHNATVANGTTMNFRTAIMPALSNGASAAPNNPCISDTPAVPSPCRLAGWLTYNANGVIQVDANSSFRSTVYDPDRSNQITYNTSGQFNGIVGVPGTIISPTQIRLGVAPDFVTITYVPKATTTIANAYPSATTDLGSFQVTKSTAAALLPLNLGSFVSFRLTVNQTAPWSGTAVYTLTLGTPSANLCPGQLFHISFPSGALKVGGTSFTVTGLSAGSLAVGCPAVSATTTQQVQATVVAPEPRRVVVRSIGFGPNFARKQVEMMVQRGDLDFEAPATLTIRGADDCSPLNFDSGSSGAKTYSGLDHSPAGQEAPRPAFAVMECSLPSTNAGIKKPGTVDDPKIGVCDNANPPAPYIPVNLPRFLQTADNARQYLNDLEVTARTQSRYFKPAGSMSSNEGTAANPVLTFIDGDCTLDGGAGFLVVTGNLTMSGNPSFDGVVLVMGEGSVTRSGGGNGTYNGAMVVAKFARTWPAADNGLAHPFLTPTFNTNGGGNSDFQYNSQSVSRALTSLGSRVAGVLEY